MTRPTRLPTSGLVARVVAGVSLCVGLAPATVRAQTIEGVLLERSTDRPVELGLVTLFTAAGDSVASVLSDVAGRFRVRAEGGGEYLLAASALGYRSTVAGSVFELPEGASMSVEFRIEAVPIELGGLIVVTDPSIIGQPNLVQNGFVDRARQGFGTFVTPVDLAETTAYSTTEVLARTGRVTTRYALGGDRILMRGIMGYCTPSVYVDGMRVSLEGMSLDAFVPLQVLDGIEVYRSPEIAPPQYAVGTSRCGIIVLWTKSH